MYSGVMGVGKSTSARLSLMVLVGDTCLTVLLVASPSAA